MKDKVLTSRQLSAAHKKLPQWVIRKNDTVLRRVVPIESYLEGLVVLARITVHANVHDHHPTVTLTPSQITIDLTTHDVGGITARDTKLAQVLETTLH